MYTNQEKREIERVLTAFKPYIEQADYVGDRLVKQETVLCGAFH